MNSSEVATVALRSWLASMGRSQTWLARELDVSRAAVSRWCMGGMNPTPNRARRVEKLSRGAVPASLWPRRIPARALTKGARAINHAALTRGLSMLELARQIEEPGRSMTRWASGEHCPQDHHLARLNAKLGLKLVPADFGVCA